MMGDLFEHAHARSSDPDTSKKAAAGVDVTKIESAVYGAIKGTGDYGATWDDICAVTKIDKGSVSPRLRPLRDKGLIRPRVDTAGEVVTRRSKMGRGQTVWVAT